MNITLPAHYTELMVDDSLFAAQLIFDPSVMLSLRDKVKDLAATIPGFQKITVRFSGKAHFIVSFFDESNERSFKNEDGNLDVKVHAEPISDELFDSVCLSTVDLHVSRDGFYAKGFDKESDNCVETEMIEWDKFTKLVG